ncbi:hypothetical protein CsSME_00026318 [Camellia sinensis var. sinensis]
MNPKISDFGLARSFGGNETKANTNRVVGTYGYMPPEYAVHGYFSVKSDREEKQRFRSCKPPSQPSWACDLLCVQQCPEDRPSMSSVVLMLGGEGALPRPKQPGFFAEMNQGDADCSTSRDAPSSTNEVTVTLDGR